MDGGPGPAGLSLLHDGQCHSVPGQYAVQLSWASHPGHSPGALCCLLLLSSLSGCTDLSLEDMLSSYPGPLTLVTVQKLLPPVVTLPAKVSRSQGLLPSCLGLHTRVTGCAASQDTNLPHEGEFAVILSVCSLIPNKL